MDEFRIEQRGKQMTERAAIRAEEGMRSRSAAQLHFREARASSHHATCSLLHLHFIDINLHGLYFIIVIIFSVHCTLFRVPSVVAIGQGLKIIMSK